METIRQLVVLRGKAVSTLGATSHDIDPVHSVVISAGTPTRLECSAGFDQLVLAISADALTKQLRHLTGDSAVRVPQFDGPADLGRPEGQRFRRLIEFVAGEFTAGRAPPPPNLLAEFEDALITAFLLSNCSDLSTLLERGAPEIAPWQVRAAEDYIAAHWQQPLTVEILAEQIGASARSIFQSFKRARGYSPMSFLKRVRLNHARARLESPEAGTSVTAVGYACGFHNLSHFASDYMKEFGETPSQTLKRARGR